MNLQPTNGFVRRNNIVVIALGTAGVLVIPLAAMQFTAGVKWTAFDFLVAGILLFGTGLMFNFAMWKFRKHQLIAGTAIAVAFMYVWAELAVGIFTSLGS